jgi:branched-subunit amino acid aminotransferase/4-amino-4-deoxychorismate lyase
VAGIMRQQVLGVARGMELGVEVCDLGLAEARAADEIFLTNAVTGIRPVIEIQGERSWAHGEVTRALQARIDAGLAPP